MCQMVLRVWAVALPLIVPLHATVLLLKINAAKFGEFVLYSNLSANHKLLSPAYETTNFIHHHFTGTWDLIYQRTFYCDTTIDIHGSDILPGIFSFLRIIYGCDFDTYSCAVFMDTIYTYIQGRTSCHQVWFGSKLCRAHLTTEYQYSFYFAHCSDHYRCIIAYC